MFVKESINLNQYSPDERVVYFIIQFLCACKYSVFFFLLLTDASPESWLVHPLLANRFNTRGCKYSGPCQSKNPLVHLFSHCGWSFYLLVLILYKVRHHWIVLLPHCNSKWKRRWKRVGSNVSSESKSSLNQATRILQFQRMVIYITCCFVIYLYP